jgi:hypothetical protein
MSGSIPTALAQLTTEDNHAPIVFGYHDHHRHRAPDFPRRLAAAFTVAARSVTGCYAHRDPEPAGHVDVAAAPVDIETYSSVVSSGQPVYFNPRSAHGACSCACRRLRSSRFSRSAW